MNYKEFKEELGKRLSARLQSDYGNAYAKASKIQKVNQELDSLMIVIHGQTMYPTIYSEHLYDRYNEICDITIQKGLPENPMDVLLDETCGMIKESLEEYPEALKGGNVKLEKMPDQVVLQLVNTEQNRKLLENVPHREFEDLSVIYRWAVGTTEEGVYSTIVSNEMAEQTGMSEEELFARAGENTKRLFPAEVSPMLDVIVEIIAKDFMDSMPEEQLESFGDESPEHTEERVREKMMEEIGEGRPYPMYVITNTERSYGAVEMLFPENLEKVSEILHDDLYILPSSIHEVIALPAGNCEPQELAKMVREVNAENLTLEERLSNQVYYYDSREKKLSTAGGIDSRRIDFAEPVSVDAPTMEEAVR